MKGSGVGKKIGQIASAVGTAITSASQISSLIKQAKGKDPGKLEAILGLVGTSVSIAGSLTSIISGYATSNNKNDKNAVDENGNIKKVEGSELDEHLDGELLPRKQQENTSEAPESPETTDTQPSAEETAIAANLQQNGSLDNPEPVEAEIDGAIAAAQDVAAQQPETEVSKEITNYNAGDENVDPEVQNLVDENQNVNVTEREKTEPIKTLESKEVKSTVDPEQDLQSEFTGMSKKEIRQWKLQKFQAKMEKPLKIMGDVGNVATQGMQLYSNIEQLNSAGSAESDANALIYDMKQGKSLMKKIKRRRHNWYGYARA